MTEPITDEELDPCENFPEDSKWTCLNADAFHDTCRPCAIRLRIDLERNRADEAERKLAVMAESDNEAWSWVDDLCDAVGEKTTVFTFKDDLAKLHADEAEVERLRGFETAARQWAHYVQPHGTSLQANNLALAAALTPKPKEPSDKVNVHVHQSDGSTVTYEVRRERSVAKPKEPSE